MTPLAHALTYALHGWRVAPVRPGTKWPRLDAWQLTASTDEATLRAWWAEHPDDGVSVVTGSGSRLVVVDVDVKDGKGGDESLAALEAAYEPLPASVRVHTPSGGLHIYLRTPEGFQPPTYADKNGEGPLGAGIDVRGEGGQVVAPPSVSGDPRYPGTYTWSFDGGDPLAGETAADAPPWLLELLAPRRTEARPLRTLGRASAGRLDEPPGVRYAARVTWPELLEADGWTLHTPAGRHGYELWTRPGKDPRHGASASLYYGGSDSLKVFSTDASLVALGLQAGKAYGRFAYYAARHHGGDHSRAARALRAEEDARRPTPAPSACPGAADDAPELDPNDDEVVDLAPIMEATIDGTLTPVTPTVLEVDEP